MHLLRFTTLAALIAVSSFAAPASDEGTGIDPHGRPSLGRAACDEGSGLDPHGRPCPVFLTDKGMGLDPNG